VAGNIQYYFWIITDDREVLIWLRNTVYALQFIHDNPKKGFADSGTWAASLIFHSERSLDANIFILISVFTVDIAAL
jgi:hypothetical protein